MVTGSASNLLRLTGLGAKNAPRVLRLAQHPEPFLLQIVILCIVALVGLLLAALIWRRMRRLDLL